MRGPLRFACFFPSHICSCPLRKSHAIFGGDRLGKKNPPGAPIGDRAPAFFYRPILWVGKKILRHAPANPFGPPKIACNFRGTKVRFARRAVNLRGPPFLRFRWEGKIEDRSFPFLMGPDQRSGPVKNEKRAITDLPNSPKARPRESIRSPENCMQFSGDKSEIRVAGGLNKGDPRFFPPFAFFPIFPPTPGPFFP